MLTGPVQATPVTRVLATASPAQSGADLSNFWPYPFPAEGTDQSWVIWSPGNPAEGVDQSWTPWVMPSEGVDA